MRGTRGRSVKGVRAIRCPHLCCQLMPGHCEGSSRKRTESPRKVLPCRARKRSGQKGQKTGKKQGRPRKSTADGYWCEFSTDSGRPPPCLFTLGGYRLTAIRLNLFHHKRLNKEVHSSGPATAAVLPRLVSFRRLPLSDTVHHLRSSIWISFFSKAKSPKLPR